MKFLHLPHKHNSLYKFHCGNHKLPVYHGCYLKYTFQQLYSLCEANGTGYEFHYLLGCSAFNEAHKCMKHPCWENPSVHKMNELLIVGNVGQLVNVAKFIGSILSRF